jgi:Tfp pilus assembly protein PilN
VRLGTLSLFNQALDLKMPSDGCLLINTDDGFIEVILSVSNAFEFSRAIPLTGKNSPDKDFILELERTICVIQDKGYAIKKVVLCGKPALELEGFIKEKLNCDIEINNSISVLRNISSDTQRKGIMLNLLPREYKEHKIIEKRKRDLAYLIALLFLNIAVVTNIFFLKIKTKEEYLSLLKAEISKIDSQAAGLQKKTFKTTVLQNSSDSSRVILGLWSEIYRAAPEGVILSTIDIANQKAQNGIVLTGQAPVSEVVLAFANSLKSTGFIKKADVIYITKRKLSTQQAMDFEIRASF